MSAFYALLALFFVVVGSFCMAAVRSCVQAAWHQATAVRYLLLLFVSLPLLACFLACTVAVMACLIAAYRAA